MKSNIVRWQPNCKWFSKKKKTKCKWHKTWAVNNDVGSFFY